MFEIKQRHMTLLRDMGTDILASPEMNYERKLLQHGNTSCYRHSIRVACLSLQLAEIFAIQVDVRSMIRGALLHDFFLYDWHAPEPTHRLHGITHPKKALQNAERLFSLNDIERDIIRKHMFPLTLFPPKYRESLLVCLVDKFCAVEEILSVRRPQSERVIVNGSD